MEDFWMILESLHGELGKKVLCRQTDKGGVEKIRSEICLPRQFLYTICSDETAVEGLNN